MKEWKVTITTECIELLMSKNQVGGREDCGLLFASQISDDCLRINSVSSFCVVQTSASKCSCKLDTEKANAVVVEEFEKSNHTRFYIGEWHTHPEDNPTPSIQDINSIKKSYQRNELVIPNLLFMAIVGMKSICWKTYNGSKICNVVLDHENGKTELASD